MKYIVSYAQPQSHLVDIEFIVTANKQSSLQLQLPAWRPGRYELGNFAKNIQSFGVFDAQGHPLPFKKTSKDSWEVQTGGAAEIRVRYNYFAFQLDAGACWLDDKQLYINGVHCFVYVPERMNEECTVELRIPDDYKVATGLKQLSAKTFGAKDFHQLVDCPFIASNSLQNNSYEVNGVQFHIWFQGECKPDWAQIIKDFKAFTQVQLDMMQAFPDSVYHFLVQIVPAKLHHGVEHTNNTVLAFGPGYSLMKDDVYADFIGLASHELFHAWNVKTIRPIEMQPYNYTKENYSRLGFVAEGVTTYYGDLLVCRAGNWKASAYLDDLKSTIQRHLDNYGRFSMSVGQASYDTWLDGYLPGIPNRKVSIYDEGSLCALMLDFMIRKHTNSAKSLDDVMRILNKDYALKGKGYSETDYYKAAESVAGMSLQDFFNNYIYSPADYEPQLNTVLAYAGLELVKKPASLYFERYFGFKVLQDALSTKVTTIIPGSVSYFVGLSKDDEVISINGFRVENNLAEWCSYFDGPIIMEVLTQKQIRSIKLVKADAEYYAKVDIHKIVDASAEQKAFFQHWCMQTF